MKEDNKGEALDMKEPPQEVEIYTEPKLKIEDDSVLDKNLPYIVSDLKEQAQEEDLPEKLGVY